MAASTVASATSASACFVEAGRDLRLEGFYFLPLFSQGLSKRFRNVTGGTNELVFGFEYTTGRGKHQHRSQQTVAAFRVNGADFPAFDLKPANFADRVAAGFGGQDIDFPEDPEFSKAFRLRGTGELMTRELFDEAARYLLRENPDCYLQGSREWVLAFRAGIRPKASGMVEFVAAARRITRPFVER